MILNNPDLSYKNGDSATVDVVDWLLLDVIGLLNIIPIVGTVVCLVLYIVIAANRETAPSVQNRIIVSFIWLGVWIFVMILFNLLVVAGVLNVGWLPSFLNSLPFVGA